MKNTAKIFKALSNETRLKIMTLVSQNELCVCEIEKALKISQTAASRHLTILKYSGLVRDRRDGLWIYYSSVMPTDEIGKKIFICFNELIKIHPELKVHPGIRNSCAKIKKGRCYRANENNYINKSKTGGR